MDVTRLVNSMLIDLRSEFNASGFDIRFVGGCVRDMLLGLDPNDIDLHTDANPDEQIAIYENLGIRHIPTGLQHGTVTVVLDGTTYEITSLRRDVETDGRHAVVEYTRNWELDLERRDFTINAMSMSLDGELFDPFGGKTDLQNGIVRFVGDAQKRISEDYLRILRWFRFRGRFERDDNQDLQARVWTKRLAKGLANISRERIWSEIAKIVSGPNGPDLMWEIHELGCAEFCSIGKSSINTFHTKRLHKRTKHPITLMVDLYGVHAVSILTKWKASSAEIKMASALCAMKTNTRSLFECLAVDQQPRDWVIQAAYLRGLDDFDIAVLEDWVIPAFPVTGYDLIALGMKPGPRYGEVMSLMKDKWAKHGFAMNKEKLLSFVEV